MRRELLIALPLPNADLITQIAREYKDTPWRPQGKCRAGVDCGGLLACIATDPRLHLYTPEQMLELPKWREVPSRGMMLKEMSKWFQRIPDVAPGCLVACKQGNSRLVHAMVITSDFTVIHTSRMARKVVEVGLCQPLLDDMVSKFAFQRPEAAG